jgi:hypothetical protein
MAMKKLLLTSIAALLLAGTARADDESDAVLQERCKNGATYWCTILQGRLTPPKKTVLYGEAGGNVRIYLERFQMLKASGDEVEVRSYCVSACTFIMIFVPKERLCFGEAAWLGFHQARRSDGTVSKGTTQITELLFDRYPSDIRRWIDERGGAKKMPVGDIEFWAISASELWKMGYRKCDGPN